VWQGEVVAAEETLAQGGPTRCDRARRWAGLVEREGAWRGEEKGWDLCGGGRGKSEVERNTTPRAYFRDDVGVVLCVKSTRNRLGNRSFFQYKFIYSGNN
jgi:hypothetical protein